MVTVTQFGQLRWRTVAASAILAILAALLLGCAPSQSQSDAWPTASWRSTTPEEQGLDSVRLADALLTLRAGFHRRGQAQGVRQDYCHQLPSHPLCAIMRTPQREPIPRFRTAGYQEGITLMHAARGMESWHRAMSKPQVTVMASEPLTCPDRNKAGKFTIIDQQIYDENDQNVALSKQDFARNVLNRTPGFDDFDLFAFEALFELIEILASEIEPDGVTASY